MRQWSTKVWSPTGHGPTEPLLEVGLLQGMHTDYSIALEVQVHVFTYRDSWGAGTCIPWLLRRRYLDTVTLEVQFTIFGVYMVVFFRTPRSVNTNCADNKRRIVDSRWVFVAMDFRWLSWCVWWNSWFCRDGPKHLYRWSRVLYHTSLQFTIL